MPHPPLQASRRILVVDDNPSIHEDFKKIFPQLAADQDAFSDAEAALYGDSPAEETSPEFEIDSAFQGEEALRKVRTASDEGRPYAMAFIDMRMPPGWDGLETTVRLWEACPDLQVVICTAYSDYSWEEMRDRIGQTDRLVLLKKPFDNIEVLQLAISLTEKSRLLHESKAMMAELEHRVAERTSELRDANARLHEEMAERARTEEALRHAQKLEGVGQVAGGIAHDFNNILAIIRGHAGFLLGQKELAAAAHIAVQVIDSAAERAAGLTRQLLTFCRKQVMQPQNLSLNEVIAEVGPMLHHLLGEGIVLEVEQGNDLPSVIADRAMLEQVILNLAANARDAMAHKGRLVIRSFAVERSEEDVLRHPHTRAGRFASLSVSDNGSGIAPEALTRIFEPFFTTKEVGAGTGLGLATVYGILKQHDGWIEVESTPGVGSTFTVFLPGHPMLPAVEPAQSRAATGTVGGNETVLLVEDEPSLREVTEMLLQDYGYRVFTACSGLDALNGWPSHSAEVDLVLTDMVMPDGISGRELAQRLQADKAKLKILFSSGYSREDILIADANFLPKPYTPDKLAAMVRNCLDGTIEAAAGATA